MMQDPLRSSIEYPKSITLFIDIKFGFKRHEILHIALTVTLFLPVIT